MRSRFEELNALVGDLSDPTNPYRSLSLAQLEQLVRAQRAMMIGQALGDGILWLIRLPTRLRTLWTQMTGSRRALGRI